MSNISNPGSPSGSHTSKRAVRSPFIDWTTDVASWMDEGVCVTSNNPDAWFDGDAAAAKAVCNSECPVVGLCLARALELEETGVPWGVWGGMSAQERVKLRALRRKAKGPLVIPVSAPQDAA